MNTRELVVEILTEILEKEKYGHLVIRDVLQKYDYLDGRDKSFIKRLTEGVIERKIQIDYIINLFSKVPVNKQKPFIRTLLRMSVYQLCFMDSVPDSAVCNEAVKLCKKKSFHNLQGFVNGVLRNIARNKEDIKYPDRGTAKTEYLSVIYSMPGFLVEKLIEEHGEENAEKMLAGFMNASPVTVRIREDIDEASKNAMVDAWRKEGVEAEKHPYLSYAYRLRGAEGVAKLSGYDAGDFIVQDVSSMLVCEAAGIQKGNTIIDVCAAPGGKTIHAAEKTGKDGFVSARDLTDYKAELIKENINRMGRDNCQVLVWDATELRKEDIGSADVLLADLPCSGLGIMGKKKDIRYHASEEGLAELASLQRKILSTVWQYVKPGGVMIYSTCTINRQENEENVKWFTDNYPFHTESMEAYLPKQVAGSVKDGMLQLLPGIHETDGFFIARLKREV